MFVHNLLNLELKCFAGMTFVSSLDNAQQ